MFFVCFFWQSFFTFSIAEKITISGRALTKEVISEPADNQTIEITHELPNPPLSKEKLRELTTNIDYVAAIIEPFILKDFDLLPLQEQHWQTEQVCKTICNKLTYMKLSFIISGLISISFQLMGAYMTLLSRRFSTYGSNVVYMHFHWVTKILDGQFVGDLPYNLGRGIFFSDTMNKVKLQYAQQIISTYHKGSNHWTLFHVDLCTNIVNYVDPKKDNWEMPHPNFILNWNTFWNKYRRQCLLQSGPEVHFQMGPRKQHTIQGTDDAVNCGIYTLAVSIDHVPSAPYYNIYR